MLSAVNKGETYDSSVDALKKLKDAGIKRSVMILIGLGGKQHSAEHATHSAALCSEAEPDFLSLLTTSFPRGKARVEDGYRSIKNNNADDDADDDASRQSFKELSTQESLEEMKLFLQLLTIPREGRTIFRSDHASNYFTLKGILGRDKEKLLAELQVALDGDGSKVRPEWLRGL